MEEEPKKNPILGKKTLSPKKLTTKEEENLMQKNMTEQVTNKSKAFLLSSKMTQEFTEEDELEGISIAYKEQDKKIKLISLDLLLKKIIFENFIEKNPIQIFSFCQQCYCFMDKEIMFNKIFNCYNFYKEKKLPIKQIGNLIKFLCILVIELYEYYTKMKLDDPTIVLLKTIYNSLFFEICETINKEEEKKAEEEENFNINDFQNKLEEYNDEELDNNNNDKNDDVFKDRCSENLQEDTKEVSRERFGTIAARKEDGRFSSYLDDNNEKNDKELISRNTINIGFKKEDKKSKKNEKEKKKEEKEEKKKKKG